MQEGGNAAHAMAMPATSLVLWESTYLRRTRPQTQSRGCAAQPRACLCVQQRTNIIDTIHDNHYQSATGDTVQLDVTSLQSMSRWGHRSRVVRGLATSRLGVHSQHQIFESKATRQQTVSTKATTKTNYAQRGIDLEIEQHFVGI